MKILKMLCFVVTIACSTASWADASEPSLLLPLLGEGAGACSEADQDNYIHPQNDEFTQKVNSCARSSWGRANATTNCLVRAYPDLSRGCASCFGSAASCMASKCFTSCSSDDQSEACTSCYEAKCGPAVEACTGVPRENLPLI